MGIFKKGSTESWRITFDSLPKSLDQLKELKEASLKEPYFAPGLLIPALSLWPENKEEAIKMINFLRGPAPLSTYEIQFISERLKGNEYIANSYYEGSSPENGYKGKEPFSVMVYSLANSFDEEGYAQLYLQSSGADSKRPVKLRNKPSSGEWFLTDQMLLSQIRKPVADDPWA